MVQDHIREVRESLPSGYYRELPELALGPLAGYPRVYEVAIAVISHTEARVDAENLELFLAAFQEVAPLSIGELWAVPAMLRFALVESVRRMGLRAVQALDATERADALSAWIGAAGHRGARELDQAVDEFVGRPPPLDPPFVSRFLHRLRSTEGSLPQLERLESWVAGRGMSADEAGARSTQRLALTQIVMANSITSLRTLAHLDWKTLVERLSVLDAILRDDPAGFYARMTFATRDRYRHVVERIARRTRVPEEAVARRAIDMAATQGAVDGGENAHRTHVGYYLVDDGLPLLERASGYRRSWREALHRAALRRPGFVLGGGILAGSAFAMAALFSLAGPSALAAVPLVVLLAMVPSVDIAVSVVNQLVTAFLPPRTLPKLDLRGGIPPEYRTAVVIPILFADVEAVHEALGNLEVQFLANRDAHLHFAVLSDFADSPTESCPGDADILRAAVEGVRSLNARYGRGGEDAFHLFHRARRWNASEGVWMGWERKRGKLAELNRFLRGGAGEAFSEIVGDATPLRGVRFVITLDADTVLPPDAAPLLVGALAHPLNRAVFDPRAGRVVRGYGILQPRVGVSLPSAQRSIFSAVHSGRPGVDPYTTAVSDVYQDLYGEGSFTGKGIYDVDAFEEATRGRFPENTLLSHDLIEGSYARAGLATDLEVYDDYPSSYFTWTRRKHRWIRGDWQLLGWLTPWVPGPSGPERNRLPLLARWKISDNLRRSTFEIALLLFLVAGWTVLPGSPLRWTALGLGALAAPWIVALLLAALRPPMDRSWRAYYRAVARDAVTSAQQVGLALTFLPHQAWISADAIGRTLWRLLVSRSHLLEWQTASAAEHAQAGAARDRVLSLMPALAAAGSAAILVGPLAMPGGGPSHPWMLAAGLLPMAALWAASPLVARAVSAPARDPGRRTLSQGRRADALRYALLHWRFFDRFVTAETHWLVPDNFQEDPSPVVAMRTSPTNLGLQLLATASAHDLGFLTPLEMTRRLELAFGSLERLRRLRGHFFNWYDLNDLQVLEPAYVSSVDSGNLAGHLIALAQACLAVADGPVFHPRLGAALDAALALAGERLHALAEASEAPPERRAAATAAQAWVAGARAALESEGGDALSLVEQAIEAALATLVSAEGGEEEKEPSGEWLAWSGRLVAGFRAWLDELGVSPPRGPVAAEGRGPAPGLSLRDLAGRSTAASSLVERLEGLAERARRHALEMDFRLVFDEDRALFAIGYREASRSLDDSYYDLLASESRLASFIAIAKNDVPMDHWFRLGRGLTRSAGATALVSWSGSMFEYLMPALVMRSLPFTLLDQSCRSAVRRQMAYGSERVVPWGVSESAYNVRDRHLTYQYRAFGVPDLALKRGLGQEMVVAPYASALALAVDPDAAIANLLVLEGKGALGRWGFREALDYTRPEPGRRYALVGTYMAHHIGMGLASLANVLVPNLWQERFHADPMVRSAELLLHERVPRRLVLGETQDTPRLEQPDRVRPPERPAARVFETPDTATPHVALLGRLPYTLMLSHCGGGYSRYQDLAVTRWRADGTTDATGQFCYLKDVGAGRTWSAAHQPLRAPADRYRALLATDRVVFQREDGPVETRTEVVVVPEEAAEVRVVTLTNHGGEPREIELTSYGEVVLAPPDADRAHPAFAKLFVETEWHPWCAAVTATRRPRSAGEASVWCVHVVATGPERVGPVSCETDRGRFLGRGRGPGDPVALTVDGPLGGTVGAVLDPIFALRTRVLLEAGQTASVAFTTLVATTRERAFELADRYHDPHAAARALDLAWTSQQVELRDLDLTPADAGLFQEIAGYLFYHHAEVRAPREELGRNRGSRSLLWANGISGDLPIVLATIDSAEGLPTLRQLFQAHQYWRCRGMEVDLVALETRAPSYQQELRTTMVEALFASGGSGLDRPGGVFLRRRSEMRADELLMLRATARFHVYCDGRSLAQVVEALAPPGGLDAETASPPSPPRPLEPPMLASQRARAGLRPAGEASPLARLAPPAAEGRAPSGRGEPVRATAAGGELPALLFDNGLGGLTPEGDYLIRVRGDSLPPAPWANVIANPHGGFLVSERGAGFTWAGSSHFFRLTPWHNDPVSDPTSDVLYLQDEAGELWSPTPAPFRGDSPYTVRHGAGRSEFEHEHAGIATTLSLGMPDDAAVKISLLRLTNRGSAARRLTLTAYAEWALGAQREHTQHQVLTSFDPVTGAIFARNFFEPGFAHWVAFLAINEPVAGHTGDRREFLGRNGGVEAPAALAVGALGGSTGAGSDPCGALQCVLALEPGETREVVVLLGAAPSEAEARDLLGRHRDPRLAREAMSRSLAGWDERLSVITVRTPEPSFDAMLNRWALYQTLSCRVWARSGLYQSSGAYGFRDQLQDVMALVYAEPGLAREHILRAAARQFAEGDVQHWWHPESGRGVRTRFSDDLAWLPLVVDHYVRVTGDASVLEEEVPFLAMRALEPGEHELYDLPEGGGGHASLYEHCLRALRRASTVGAHGLPLMGGGDWNDGMNRVGVEGRGESVWLAWFLAAALRAFSAHAGGRGEPLVAAELEARAASYAAAAESHGWDGDWYRRAYFDDGTPLGSALNVECRIDSIAQSWSVISGAGDGERQGRALRAVEEHLVDRDARLVKLLAPPFDRGPGDPGYIRGYLPGVRENGAQYTHAALWVALAAALRGEGERAFELYQMANPLTRSATAGAVMNYRVEPYVVAADVYDLPGQRGRGGWTWYTGSASWMYRVGLEAILGFTKRGETLRIDPCVPAAWSEFAVQYRFGGATYSVVVRRPAELRAEGAVVWLDGRELDGPEIPLRDDGGCHQVVVEPRRAQRARAKSDAMTPGALP